MPLLPVSQLAELSPVFRGRLGNAFASFLRRFFSMKKLSDLYDAAAAKGEGAELTRALLAELQVEYRVGNAHLLEKLPQGPFITVSNHPYGGLDGVMLIDLMGHAREGFKVMATEVLTLAEALTPSLIVVNPKTDASQAVTSKSIQGIRQMLLHLQSGNPVGLFPSGAVSDLSLKDKCIRDREWQPSVLRLIKKAHVPVVPVRFFDRNTSLFYLLGLIDWRVRILRLPHEVVNKHGQRPRIGLGPTITVEEQDRFQDLEAYGAFLREKVYGMSWPD